MKKYVVSHVGKKGTQVAHETVSAQNKAKALEIYLKEYCKQTKSACMVVLADDDAEVTLPRPRKAKAKAQEVKAEPKAKAKKVKTGVTEYGAKAKENAPKGVVKLVGKRVDRVDLFTEECKVVTKFKGASARIDGTWMYVAGITKDDTAYHAKLKEMGFRYSDKKHEWYKIGAEKSAPVEPKVTEVKTKTRKAKAPKVEEVASDPVKQVKAKTRKGKANGRKTTESVAVNAKVKAPKKSA